MASAGRFCEARVRSARAVASSSRGSGRSSAAAERMPSGTAAVISASSDSCPIASSMWATAASSGPMCRATNSPSPSTALEAEVGVRSGTQAP